LKAHGNIADIARNDRRDKNDDGEGMKPILLSQQPKAKSQRKRKKNRPLRGRNLSGLVGEVLRGGG
jgi:hypothetical protein